MSAVQTAFIVILISIVLIIVCVFFGILFKLICCSGKQRARAKGHSSNNEKDIKMHLNNVKLIQNKFDTSSSSGSLCYTYSDESKIDQELMTDEDA